MGSGLELVFNDFLQPGHFFAQGAVVRKPLPKGAHANKKFI